MSVLQILDIVLDQRSRCSHRPVGRCPLSTFSHPAAVNVGGCDRYSRRKHSTALHILIVFHAELRLSGVRRDGVSAQTGAHRPLPRSYQGAKYSLEPFLRPRTRTGWQQAFASKHLTDVQNKSPQLPLATNCHQ